MYQHGANTAIVDRMEGISPLPISNTCFKTLLFKEDTHLSAFRVFPDTDSPLAVIPTLFLVHIRKAYRIELYFDHNTRTLDIH